MCIKISFSIFNSIFKYLSEKCERFMKDDIEYYISPKYILNENINAIFEKMRKQFPEITSKKKLFEFIPFFIKIKKTGWASQCTCIS